MPDRHGNELPAGRPVTLYPIPDPRSPIPERRSLPAFATVLRELPDGRYLIQLDPNPLTFATDVSDEAKAMTQEIRSGNA